jgi:hypothetical protein
MSGAVPPFPYTVYLHVGEQHYLYVVPSKYGADVPKIHISYTLQMRRIALGILRNAKHHFLCDDARTAVWCSFLVTRQWRHCRRRKRTEIGSEGRGNNRFLLFASSLFSYYECFTTELDKGESNSHTSVHEPEKRILSLKIRWRQTPSFSLIPFRASLHNWSVNFITSFAATFHVALLLLRSLSSSICLNRCSPSYEMYLKTNFLLRKKKENKCNNLFSLHKTELPIYCEQNSKRWIIFCTSNETEVGKKWNAPYGPGKKFIYLNDESQII